MCAKPPPPRPTDRLGGVLVQYHHCLPNGASRRSLNRTLNYLPKRAGKKTNCMHEQIQERHGWACGNYIGQDTGRRKFGLLLCCDERPSATAGASIPPCCTSAEAKQRAKDDTWAECSSEREEDNAPAARLRKNHSDGLPHRMGRWSVYFQFNSSPRRATQELPALHIKRKCRN